VTRLDWRTKGLPAVAEGSAGSELGALGLRLLDGDLMMPAAVLRERALHNNIGEMHSFAERCGVKLCPHGKTSMSPELFALQLEAGAWGITSATAHHVRIYRRLGIGRIFLANQLAARADIEFILSEIAADPDFDFYCLADSPAGVDLLADAAAGEKCPRPIQLLVEAGIGGGRSGVRTAAEGIALARHITARAPWVALRGVETFEGVRQTVDNARAEAVGMLELAVEIAEAAAGEGLFAPGPVMLSAGGSAFLDLCTSALPAAIGGRGVERVIRPGCYVTHDSGLYRRLTAPDGEPLPGLPRLEHALEVWGVVQSLPEPGLAIVGVGKRDVSYDVEPPIPLRLHRPRSDADPRAAEGLHVGSLWDQHLSLAGDTAGLRIGDLVGFGISHPCGTFDRWTALFTVDDDYRVTGAVTTLF
jgi:D-serine dehydratase